MSASRLLFFTVAMLGLIGTLIVYSSTRDFAGGSYAIRQAIWIGLGLVLMVLAQRINIVNLSALTPLAYLAVIILLGLVLIIGSGPQGAKRWFDLGIFALQPSELAKIAVLLMLARLLTDRKDVSSMSVILRAAAAVAVPSLLILNEPDLGTSVVVGMMLFPMLFIAGLHPIYLALLASPIIGVLCAWQVIAWVIFVAMLLLLIVFGRFNVSLVSLVLAVNIAIYIVAPRLWQSLAPYQRDRFLGFLYPERHRYGAAFQTIQSQIAIGSGGFFGKGIFAGTQKAWGLVAERHTDFIFSVIGEELGFFGCICVLGLLAILVLGLLRICRNLTTRFAVYFCFGVAMLILIQTFINVGMTIGIVPVTGLPLPLVSYGGSQVIVLCTAIGIILGAYKRGSRY
ncbi:MAG: FtsW/RodA/SpoVE family cell cycle protein [bacterium]